MKRRTVEDDFLDDESELTRERFSARSKNAQRNKMEKTAQMRREQAQATFKHLPMGQVVQIYSLFSHVASEHGDHVCTVRSTLNKLAETSIVVGDHVRFDPTGGMHELGMPEAVIEWIEPRDTLLTRADSFKGLRQSPLVANADQMLVVAALVQPRVKWGLVDRMIIAAKAGGLKPIVCINKIDLRETDPEGPEAYDTAAESLAHYETIGCQTLMTSIEPPQGIEQLQALLAGKVSVLAGHSGVGKSSLISAAVPGLDLKVGDISEVNQKGKHTTTSARRYPLEGGGAVVDTPGVKQFGLWNITRANLIDYFPDVADESAPEWRVASYRRILSSLPKD